VTKQCGGTIRLEDDDNNGDDENNNDIMNEFYLDPI